METLLAIGSHPAHHRTVVVPHHYEYTGLQFQVLLSKLGHRRQRCLRLVFPGLLFGLVPQLPLGFEPVAQPVGEDRAVWRVGSGPEAVAPFDDSIRLLDVAQRFSRREQDGLFVRQPLFRHCAQRGVVVEDVEAATEGGHRQIFPIPLDVEFTHLDGG